MFEKIFDRPMLVNDQINNYLYDVSMKLVCKTGIIFNLTHATGEVFNEPNQEFCGVNAII